MHKIDAFFRTPLGASITIAVLWQLFMTVVGYYFVRTGLLDHTLIYDGKWYEGIITQGYNYNGAAAAFYPLFPAIIISLKFITGGILPLTVIGFILNTALLAVTIYGLTVLAREFKIKFTWSVPIFFLLAPAAFFLHLFYTEPMFSAITLWAYIFALQRRWLPMALLLMLATASRLPGILTVGLCGLEFMRAHGYKLKRIWTPSLAYFTIAPLGFVAYSLSLAHIKGDPLAMFNAYKFSQDWTYQVFNSNIFHTIARVTKAVFMALTGQRPFDTDIFVNHFVPVFTVILLVSASLYLIFKVRGNGIPLGVAGLVSLIMFSLNNNLVSVHRYILPCFGIYIVLALLWQQYRRARPLIVVLCIFTVVLQIALLVPLYTSNRFAG